jgi:hypothetical protein
MDIKLLDSAGNSLCEATDIVPAGMSPDNCAYMATRIYLENQATRVNHESPVMYCEIDDGSGLPEVYAVFATIEMCHKHGVHVYPVVSFHGFGGLLTSS